MLCHTNAILVVKHSDKLTTLILIVIMVILLRRFKCDFEGCVASFGRKKSLNSHKSKHSNDKTITDMNKIKNLEEKVLYNLRNRKLKTQE